MKEASRFMHSAFGSGVGSPSIECVCGRSHYAPDSEFCEDDEDVDMRTHAATNPAKVILHEGDDAVSAAIINGATVVRDCPCGYFTNLESILWNERERILRYYRIRRDSDASALSDLTALSAGGNDG